MFKKKLFYFQVCFITTSGEQRGIVVTNDKPFVTKKMVRNSALSLSLLPDSTPNNVFCYGRMTKEEWEEK